MASLFKTLSTDTKSSLSVFRIDAKPGHLFFQYMVNLQHHGFFVNAEAFLNTWAVDFDKRSQFHTLTNNHLFSLGKTHPVRWQVSDKKNYFYAQNKGSYYTLFVRQTGCIAQFELSTPEFQRFIHIIQEEVRKFKLAY